jgi:hypothetical protein
VLQYLLNFNRTNKTPSNWLPCVCVHCYIFRASCILVQWLPFKDMAPTKTFGDSEERPDQKTTMPWEKGNALDNSDMPLTSAIPVFYAALHTTRYILHALSSHCTSMSSNSNIKRAAAARYILHALSSHCTTMSSNSNIKRDAASPLQSGQSYSKNYWSSLQRKGHSTYSFKFQSMSDPLPLHLKRSIPAPCSNTDFPSYEGIKDKTYTKGPEAYQNVLALEGPVDLAYLCHSSWMSWNAKWSIAIKDRWTGRKLVT